MKTVEALAASLIVVLVSAIGLTILSGPGGAGTTRNMATMFVVAFVVLRFVVPGIRSGRTPRIEK